MEERIKGRERVERGSEENTACDLILSSLASTVCHDIVIILFSRSPVIHHPLCSEIGIASKTTSRYMYVVTVYVCVYMCIYVCIYII